MYQIFERIKEFARRILLLSERFLYASFSRLCLSLFIILCHRFFFGIPLFVKLYPSTVTKFCSSSFLNWVSSGSSILLAMFVRGIKLVFCLLILELDAFLYFSKRLKTVV